MTDMAVHTTPQSQSIIQSAKHELLLFLGSLAYGVLSRVASVAGIHGPPAAFYHFLMDAEAMQSCRVQSEGVKNES